MGRRREESLTVMPMKNVLYELYDGDLSRTDLVYEKDTPYGRAFESVTAAEEELFSTLTEDQKKLMKAYCAAAGRINAIARRENFASGFVMGARIMAAILDDGTHDIHPSEED